MDRVPRTAPVSVTATVTRDVCWSPAQGTVRAARFPAAYANLRLHAHRSLQRLRYQAGGFAFWTRRSARAVIRFNSHLEQA
jgi:hypothetical protein